MRLQKIRGISVLPATLRSRDCPLKDELLCPTKAELPEGLPDVGLEMEREVVEVEGVKGHTRCAPPRRGLGEHLEWPLQGWGWGVCRRGAVWKEDQLPGSGQGAGGGTCLNFSISTRGTVFVWRGAFQAPHPWGSVPGPLTICQGEGPQRQEVLPK